MEVLDLQVVEQLDDVRLAGRVQHLVLRDGFVRAVVDEQLYRKNRLCIFLVLLLR